MKTPWLKALSLVSFCLFLAACSSANRIGNVLIDLTDCAPTAQEAEFKVTLRYNNENVFAIAVASTAGKLYLNDEYIGAFTNPTPVGIPQLTSLSREGVLKVENPAALQRIRNSSASAASYRLESIMRMEVSDDKSRLKSVTNGQLDLASLRAAAK
ncbi:MAG: hypothetical protein QM715_09065 [Nibricoccus sp.]